VHECDVECDAKGSPSSCFIGLVHRGSSETSEKRLLKADALVWVEREVDGRLSHSGLDSELLITTADQLGRPAKDGDDMASGAGVLGGDMARRYVLLL